MPLNFVLAVTVYVSGDGFLPLASTEPSFCTVRVAPPLDLASFTSSATQSGTRFCSASHCVWRAARPFS